MSLEKSLEVFFGFMVLTSAALTAFVNANFIWLTAFIGFNLAQQAITGFCPAAMLMRRYGVRSEKELAVNNQHQQQNEQGHFFWPSN